MQEQGDEQHSIGRTLIEDSDLSDTEADWVGSALVWVDLMEVLDLMLTISYRAGAMTMTGIIEWWFLAMIVYPDIQKRAQRELDNVVGTGRLPTFDDYDQLPYIQAMVSFQPSTTRWVFKLTLKRH